MNTFICILYIWHYENKPDFNLFYMGRYQKNNKSLFSQALSRNGLFHIHVHKWSRKCIYIFISHSISFLLQCNSRFQSVKEVQSSVRFKWIETYKEQRELKRKKWTAGHLYQLIHICM